MLAAAHGSAGDWLEDAFVFDEFRGGSLGEGNKSVGLRLVFRAPDHTLTNEEVAPFREQIIAGVVESTGGQLRGS